MKRLLKQLVKEEVSGYLLGEQFSHANQKDIIKAINKQFPKITQKLGLAGARFVGEGYYGKAYKTSSGNIVKITSDLSEAEVSAKLIGKKLKYVANIEAVYKLPKLQIPRYNPWDKNDIRKEEIQVYAIIQERLYKLGSGDEELIDMIYPAFQENPTPRNIKREIAAARGELEITDKQAKRAGELVSAMVELAKFKIKLQDLHTGNVMQSEDGQLKIIDLRGAPGKSPKLKALRAEEIEPENQMKKEEY